MLNGSVVLMVQVFILKIGNFLTQLSDSARNFGKPIL
jgi:hypothetical protein